MSASADTASPPDPRPAPVVPIERHSLLSDQRTAAIVTPDARVVWLCGPRIDSRPLLAELLGGPYSHLGLIENALNLAEHAGG